MKRRLRGGGWECYLTGEHYPVSVRLLYYQNISFSFLTTASKLQNQIKSSLHFYSLFNIQPSLFTSNITNIQRCLHETHSPGFLYVSSLQSGLLFENHSWINDPLFLRGYIMWNSLIKISRSLTNSRSSPIYHRWYTSTPIQWIFMSSGVVITNQSIQRREVLASVHDKSTIRVEHEGNGILMIDFSGLNNKIYKP